MNAQDLKGLAVITLAEAERLGRVDDVVFETGPLRAAALRLKTPSGDRLVSLDEVRSVGADAIVAETTALVGQSDQTLSRQNLPGLAELAKLKVVDDEGSYVGQIVRLDIDPSSGRVTSLDVRKGQTLGFGGETMAIMAEQIVSVGADLMTIRHAE